MINVLPLASLRNRRMRWPTASSITCCRLKMQCARGAIVERASARPISTSCEIELLRVGHRPACGGLRRDHRAKGASSFSGSRISRHAKAWSVMMSWRIPLAGCCARRLSGALADRRPYFSPDPRADRRPGRPLVSCSMPLPKSWPALAPRPDRNAPACYHVAHDAS